MGEDQELCRHLDELEAHPLSDKLLAEAAAHLRRVIDSGPGGSSPGQSAVLEHPCLALLARSVRGFVAGAVLVVVPPIEAAKTMESSLGLPLPMGIALWDHYLRLAMEALEGLPVLVVSTEGAGSLRCSSSDLAAILEATGAIKIGTDASLGTVSESVEYLLVDGPEDVTSDAGERAADLEIPKEQAGGTRGADGPLAPDGTSADDPLVPDESRMLHEALVGMAGMHEAWIAPAVPRSAWCDVLLSFEGRSGDFPGSEGSLLDALVRSAGYLVDAAGGEEVLAPERPGATPHFYGSDVGADPEAYRAWYEERYVRYHPKRLPVPEGPSFSVVVPVFRPKLWMLQRAVDSVLSQSFPHFQLCLSLDGAQPEEVEAYVGSLADPRIQVVRHPLNQGISAATNRGVAVATGQFVAFLDQDDELAPEALEHLAHAAIETADADVLYSDEDKLGEDGQLCEPFFKPDWSPEYLWSLPYLGHLLVVRRSVLYGVGGLRSRFDGAQDYDLMLRCTEVARSVVHVAEVLYHWRKTAGSAALESDAKPWAHRASRRALEDALVRGGVDGEVQRGPIEGWYFVRRNIPDPSKVSIVIPFRDHPRLLRRCVDTLRELSGYPLVELVLVDNDSEEPETLALLDRLSGQPDVAVVRHPGAFNWSAVNNHGAAQASGQYLLFANDDLEARSPGWLRSMVEHGQRPEVGAVGARLLFPDGAIQHAGVVVGMGATAGHVLVGLPPGAQGYMAIEKVVRNVGAVTGACVLSRREVFEHVGGFDEGYAVAFNDIDYCLRLREAGYRIVYTPLAELTHYESRSRGYVEDRVETARLAGRWEAAVTSSDPFYSPHLTRLGPDCSLVRPGEAATLEELHHSHRAMAG